MLYWDKQCNGAAASVTDILESNNYNSFRNLANNKRFKILYSKIYAWNATCIAASVATPDNAARMVIKDYQVNIAKKVFIPVEYDSTTGTITEIKSNNIGFVLWTKHGLRMKLATSRCRIRFIDY